MNQPNLKTFVCQICGDSFQAPLRRNKGYTRRKRCDGCRNKRDPYDRPWCEPITKEEAQELERRIYDLNYTLSHVSGILFGRKQYICQTFNRLLWEGKASWSSYRKKMLLKWLEEKERDG